jgi:hypothetical protein
MKIGDPSHIKSTVIHKKQAPAQSGDASFEKVLKKELAGRGIAEPQHKPVQPLQHTRPIHAQPPSSREEVISRVSQFIDVMEEYSLKLSSPQISLKEVAPLVERMEAETHNMRLLSEALPAGDGIKAILDESLIRSSVEIIKFNRGDYV